MARKKTSRKLTGRRLMKTATTPMGLVVIALGAAALGFGANYMFETLRQPKGDTGGYIPSINLSHPYFG